MFCSSWHASFSLSLSSNRVLAGPNAGGTLILHETGLAYGARGDTGSWCRQGAALTSCQLATTEVDDSSNTCRVWKVYAAFDTTASPRLKAMSFGITYDAYESGGPLVLVDSGPCIGDEANGAHEYDDHGWPGSGGGTVLVWETTQTSHLVEAYWFAG